jgi:acyl-coenzyme A synthetase/AMP-(fatty) acid ligase
MKVEDGSLRIRSERTAYRYLGNEQPSLMSPDGFVDTGDLVDLRGDRYYFIGRRGSVINVGGLKVHPEEVEMVINKHPAVQESLVRGRRNPITGALVVADILLKQRAQLSNQNNNRELLAEDILNKCRAVFPKHKVPAKVRFVSQLDVSATGKLVRDRE